MKKIISFAAAAALFFNCITVMPASYAAAQELPNLEDTENTAVPENLIPKSDDEQAWRPRWIRNTAGRNSANIQNIADINKWNQAHGAASDYVIYVDEGKTTAPAATLGYDGILMNTDFGFEAGKTYCVSLRAKLADKSLKKTNGTEADIKAIEQAIMQKENEIEKDKNNSTFQQTQIDTRKKDIEKLIKKYQKKYQGKELYYFIKRKLYQKGYREEEIGDVLIENIL